MPTGDFKSKLIEELQVRMLMLPNYERASNNSLNRYKEQPTGYALAHYMRCVTDEGANREVIEILTKILGE